MEVIILKFIFALFFFKILVFFQTTIEKSYTSNKKQKIIYYYDKWSLRYFKVFRNILIFVGSIEFAFLERYNILLCYFGILLFVLGVLLRVLAKYQLGSFWSYHVVKFENHFLVKKGIYKFINHPSYIGNIHIPGMFLILACSISATISFILIIVFFYIRVKNENVLLNELKVNI